MKRVTALALLAVSIGFTATAMGQGDTLDMRASDRSATFNQAGKPTRGMTQTSVQASYGQPQLTNAAVGDPPISRWEYAGFVVFFEYDRVIHAVSKR